MRLRSLLVALCLLMGGTIALTGQTASAAPAALPTCNGNAYREYRPDFRMVALFPTYNSTTSCTLRQGNYDNPGVAALQWALIRCYSQPIAFDSDFGPATREALINAQTWETALGRPVRMDGVYDPPTRRAMLWPYHNPGNGDPMGCHRPVS